MSQAKAALLVRRARAAGRRRDRAGVLAAAREWPASVDPRLAWWAAREPQGRLEPTALEAAMLLLSGAAQPAARSLATRVVYVDEQPGDPERDRVRPLVAVPPAELDNYGLRDLGWLRLLGRDWRPAPAPRRGQGVLRGAAASGERLTRAALASLAARDRDGIRAAIGLAERFERSRGFSLLGYALAEEARRVGVEPGLERYSF